MNNERTSAQIENGHRKDLLTILRQWGAIIGTWIILMVAAGTMMVWVYKGGRMVRTMELIENRQTDTEARVLRLEMGATSKAQDHITRDDERDANALRSIANMQQQMATLLEMKATLEKLTERMDGLRQNLTLRLDMMQQSLDEHKRQTPNGGKP